MNALHTDRIDRAWERSPSRPTRFASPQPARSGHRGLAHAHAERPAAENLPPEELEILRREAVA
ncbi:hypothetical protein BURK2_01683 [Burkholderiales bacterium]|nr:hypothetical protein BURK2_01683 [Burkholderiales bacterium]